MEYKHVIPCNDLASLYSEVRINIIRVNNKFSAKPCEEEGRYWLDLFNMFIEPTIDISSIFGLAMELEGLAEALEDEPEEFHLSELKDIAYRLELEMMKL